MSVLVPCQYNACACPPPLHSPPFSYIKKEKEREEIMSVMLVLLREIKEDKKRGNVGNVSVAERDNRV